MDTLNLWYLSNERVYIKVRQPYIKNFFERSIKFAGSESKLSRLLKVRKISNIWAFKNGNRFTPLKLIIEIFKILPLEIKEEYKNKIENNIEKLRYGYGLAKSIQKPKLPITFSPALARIAGHLAGDGGGRIAKGDFAVYYTNQNEFLVEQFKKDVLDVFGDIDVYEYYKDSDKTIMVRFPSIVGIILMKFFGPMVGKFKHVPEAVINADNESKIMFLRAIYDDEGCISESSNKIAFGISNKQIAKSIREMLKEFGIRPGVITKREATEKWEPHYQFGLTGKDILTFSKFINFSHEVKRDKLEKYLCNRKFSHKKGEQESLILSELKHGSMTAYEISKKLGTDISRNFRKQLFKLEKANKVNVKIINRIKLYSLNR
jgi:intein/homing endonuclease